MLNLHDYVRTICDLSKDANEHPLAKNYLNQIIKQGRIDYPTEEYFDSKYKPPFVVGDLKFAQCPSWNSFSQESYDLLYKDKFYQYDNAGLLENDDFFYYKFSWREGPYETDKVHIEPNDVVVDCGANLGMFSMLSIKRGASKVYAYEPVPKTIEYLNENLIMNDLQNKVIIRPYGLYSSNKILKFVTDNDIGSNQISENGDSQLECVSLDSDITEKVDFIKADIEGSERYMLMGATDVLKKYAPKLSLCIYHNADDKKVMKNIIKKANPDYKFEFTHWKMYAKVA